LISSKLPDTLEFDYRLSRCSTFVQVAEIHDESSWEIGVFWIQGCRYQPSQPSKRNHSYRNDDGEYEALFNSTKSIMDRFGTIHAVPQGNL